MRHLLASAVLAATVMVAGSAAQAFTLPAPPASPDSNIERVAGGCGPGWFRDVYGNCRPGGPPRYYRPYGYGGGYGYGPRCWVRPTPWGPRRVCN